MAHKTMVDGTVYDITGGRTMVGGTVYGIQKGKTMVDGTVREIGFGPSVVNVTISGTGNSLYQYVTIDGEQYHEAEDMFGAEYEFEMEPGEEIVAVTNISKRGYAAKICVGSSLNVVASTTSSGALSYTYVIPSGISSVVIELEFNQSSGASTIIFKES